MFDHEIPTAIEGFELAGGEEEAKTMKRIWPVGEGVTESIMRRFTETKMRNAKFFDPPLEGDEEKVDDPKRKSKIGLYQEGRNRVDWDGTSHISYVIGSLSSQSAVATGDSGAASLRLAHQLTFSPFNHLHQCLSRNGHDLAARVHPDRVQDRRRA